MFNGVERREFRLLTACDDLGLREAWLSALNSNSKFRSSVLVVSTGAEALSRLHEQLPDCLMLADRLADESGIDFLDRFCRDGVPDCPVVFLVGVGHEILAAEALKRGAYDYLAEETLTADTLARAVVYAIERHRTERARTVVEAARIQEAAERKQAVDLSMASDRRMRADRTLLAEIVESSHAAVIGKTLDGIITSWNLGAERLYGYTSGEVIGQPISLLVSPRHRAELQLTIDNLKQGGAIAPFEREHRCKNGSLVDVAVSISRIRDEDGKVVGASTIALDVTDRTRYLKDAQRQTRELAMLNSVMTGICSSLQLSRVLELLRNQLRDEMTIEAGATFLDPTEQDDLSPQLTWGLSEKDLSTVSRQLDDAFRNHKPSAEQESDFTALSRALTSALDRADTEWEACMVVPLVVDARLFGITALFSHAPDALRENQAAFYEALGGQISIAIHNAQLFERVRAGRKQLHTLSQQLIQAQETERRQIARELHDQIGQALTAVTINLEKARERHADVPALAPVLADSLSMLGQTLQQVRGLSLDLHPSLLDDFGLGAALRSYLIQQAERSDLKVVFHSDAIETRVPEVVEISCYRIAQEAVTNILRHSGATRIEMELHVDKEQELELIVRDNGNGFDVGSGMNELVHYRSMGLLGMRERAMLAGGQFHLRSFPGQGTEVRARFPLAAPHGYVERRRYQRPHDER